MERVTGYGGEWAHSRGHGETRPPTAALIVAVWIGFEGRAPLGPCGQRWRLFNRQRSQQWPTLLEMWRVARDLGRAITLAGGERSLHRLLQFPPPTNIT